VESVRVLSNDSIRISHDEAGSPDWGGCQNYKKEIEYE